MKHINGATGTPPDQAVVDFGIEHSRGSSSPSIPTLTPAQDVRSRTPRDLSAIYDRLFIEGRPIYYDVIRRIVSNNTVALCETDTCNGHGYPIVQFWDQDDIPRDVKAYMDCWEDCYPGRYTRYNDRSAQDFIEEHFDHYTLAAYRSCWHAAMKSDYFRLCYLLREGGCYIDADETPLTSLPPFDLSGGHLIALRAFVRMPCDSGDLRDIAISEFLSMRHLPYGTEAYFNNSPIISTRGNPIIALALDRATDLIRTGKASELSLHDVTGPTTLSLSVIVHFLMSAAENTAPSRVYSLDWLRYAHVGSNMELAYKNDERDWRRSDRG